MAWTEEQIEELEKLIAEGVSSAAFADRRVNYRSLEDLLAIRATIKGQMAGGSSRQSYTRVQFNSGLE